MKIAIISDLHCHHSSQRPAESLLISDAFRSPQNHHPIQALLAMIGSEDLHAEVVLMPGDLTNKVDPQGMNTGWSFVHEIADAFHAHVIAATLGNHDVASRTPSDDAFDFARRLVPSFPVKDAQTLAQFWAHGFCLLESGEIRVLIINSVAHHTNEASAKRGLVTSQQLERIEKALKSCTAVPFQVAVCHHHPMLHEDIQAGSEDVMVNGSSLLDLLANYGFSLVVHGHKHHPKLSYGATAGALAVLAAGSFSAGMKNGLASQTRNVFHLIELDTSQVANCGAHGAITTWQFRFDKGWSPASMRSADFPFQTGFGYVGNIVDLVNQAKTEYDRIQQPLVHWHSLRAAIPALEYLIPEQFATFGKALNAMGLEMFPRPPDCPEIVADLTTSHK